MNEINFEMFIFKIQQKRLKIVTKRLFGIVLQK